MTCPARKLIVIGVALVALVVAAGAGAVVRYTIFTVNRGQWAVLSGTKINCQNELSIGKIKIPGFVCYLYDASHGSVAVPRSYVLFITARDVQITRRSLNGRTRSVVRTYNNP
jgi:hypothetical protein